MSEIKVGDRVHVEFDGVVQPNGPHNDQWCTVLIDDSNNGNVIVRRRSCTVIVPPIAVGDVVTAENIKQLKDWSVICPDADAYNPYQKRGGVWYEMCDGETQQTGISDILLLRPDVVVLRIGGGS